MIWKYNCTCILVLKTSGVRCCSSSCVVVTNVFRHNDIDVQACSWVEISEHEQDPNLKFSETAFRDLKISQFVSIQGLISCRTSVFWHWYLTAKAFSFTDILRTSVFWHWCTHIAQQACSGNYILHNKRVLALISIRQSVFWHWYLTEQAYSDTDILHKKRTEALTCVRGTPLQPRENRKYISAKPT